MNNFTSAPWTANDKGQVFAGDIFVCSVAFSRPMPDAREPGESWLDAYARHESARDEIKAEMVGRARLIAAAPELLKAAQHCEEMLLRYSLDRIEGEEIADEALAILRAAIAKAVQP